MDRCPQCKGDNIEFNVHFWECHNCGANWEVANGCPLGGDETDCAACVYFPDYHYNKETGECENQTRRKRGS